MIDEDKNLQIAGAIGAGFVCNSGEMKGLVLCTVKCHGFVGLVKVGVDQMVGVAIEGMVVTY